jgi:hypothetical protein
MGHTVGIYNKNTKYLLKLPYYTDSLGQFAIQGIFFLTIQVIYFKLAVKEKLPNYIMGPHLFKRPLF